jgi:UDP-glucose 4-epimerase
MKVLVTGALGVNGVWVCRRLVDEGHTVIALDRSDDSSVLGSAKDRVELIKANVTDYETVGKIVKDVAPDRIVHFAAILHSGCVASPVQAMHVNVNGTLSVLEAARAQSIPRVVYASSLGVYDAFTGRFGYPQYEPVTEDYPRGPMPGIEVYGASKLLCEALGTRYHKADGIQFVALRFAHILTPGRSGRQTGSAPDATIIDPALRGNVVDVSGGDESADFIYVKDLAHAVVCAVEAPGDPSGAYNIGSGSLATLRDIADAVCQIVPAADITVGPGLNFLGLEGTYARFAIEKARASLQFEPQYDLREAVADYVVETRADLVGGRAK